LDPARNVGQSYEAGASKTVTGGKGKQVIGESTHQVTNTEEDSEDEGLKIGDPIIAGSDQLRFDTFDTLEIKMLSSIHMDDSAQVVINEYGSNLEKSKSDPFATIEAKNSICDSSRSKFFLTWRITWSIQLAAKVFPL